MRNLQAGIGVILGASAAFAIGCAKPSADSAKTSPETQKQRVAQAGHASAPPATEPSPSVDTAPLSHWQLLTRFSTLDDATGHKQPIYHVHTTSPYAVMSWARFEIQHRVTAFGTAEPHMFSFEIFGPTKRTSISNADTGDNMFGRVSFLTPGDYTIQPDCMDRYAVEIYEPVPDAALAADTVPIPSLSAQEKRSINDEYRVSNLERSSSLHSQGQEWADRQAQRADQQDRRDRIDRQMRNAGLGGGG